METQLEGKVVFITGASGGIGRALAEEFAAEGCRLALTGRGNLDELEAWCAAQPWSERATTMRLDVTDPADVSRAFEQVLSRWSRVDVCVANAGIWETEDLPFSEMSEERVRRAVEVNLLGAAWTARCFLRCVRDQPASTDGATLVFTGSTAARFGEGGHADCAMSKAGLSGLASTLKNEIARLDPRGRVNIVEPGWTATEMAASALDDPASVERALQTMSLRRVATGRDVARAVVFLASPLSAHVTGETLTVAGGMEGRVLWDPSEVRKTS